MPPKTENTKGAGARPRAQLSSSKILDAAASIVDQEGPGALTLRRLGSVLGVNHTAVLRHFTGKDQIVLGLTERLLEEALGGFEVGGDWAESMRSLARRVRSVYLVHPGIATLVAARVSRSRAEFGGAELVLHTLMQAGFEGREAAVFYRTLTDLVLAMTAFESSIMLLEPSSREGDELAMGREYLLAPAEEFPHLSSVAPLLSGISGEEIFETSLELTIEGLKAMRARRLARPE